MAEWDICNTRHLAELERQLAERTAERDEIVRRNAEVLADLRACAGALRDVLDSGVEFDDERLKYKTVQISKYEEQDWLKVLARPGVRAALGGKA